MPTISCIVPVYNGERYIREALSSILGQTHPNLEVLVVDDGSTDGTAAAVAGYGIRVSYLWQPNAGPVAARNLGLDAAQGEYVAFLDADDLWHPEKLARQLARFGARPELDLCVCHVQNFWMPELHAEAERLREHRRGRPLPGYCTSALLARRALFEVVGGFDPALQHADDTEWFLRSADQGAIVELLAEVLVYRRLHETNRSHLFTASSHADYLRVVKASLDRRRRREGDSLAGGTLPTASGDERG